MSGQACAIILALEMGETLADIGEFEMIRRLTERITPGARVLLGPGDDCAIVQSAAGPPMLATADLLIEGRHFDLSFSTAADVGFKSLAVNVSDVAAMGGTPLFALASIGAPPSAEAATLEEMYDGMDAAAVASGCALAGGDLVASERLLVSVAVLGIAPEAGAVRRDGARPGDVLAVTGALGGAAAGLGLMRLAADDADARAVLARFPGLAEAHRRGRARLREGAAAAAAGAHAMIDISDGLAADAGHICERSEVGLEIDPGAVPLAEGLAEAARVLGTDARALAMTGGDDYELAIALASEDVGRLRAAIAPTPLTLVGRFVADREVRPRGGFDHFAR